MGKKASELFRRFENPNGPAISTVARKVIEQDGLYFKDIDGTGKVTPVNDWRLAPEARAKAYTETLTLKEKLAQLFISDWRMGPKYPNPFVAEHEKKTDESGILDEAAFMNERRGQKQWLKGTTEQLTQDFSRHTILRENPTPTDMADYLNQLQYVAETCEHFVPVEVASNDRNENGAALESSGSAPIMPSWPGTLGISASVRGTGDLGIIDRFADTVRRDWNAQGLRKGYMYMADVMSDPRWQRSSTTFGEDPVMTASIFSRLVPGLQGGEDGVTCSGVSTTVKHFPGGGARENGFDPHYAAGQWNVYQTPGSLQKYHLPPFKEAVKHHPESIMPYYSKPSKEKSGEQTDNNGQPLPLVPYGFAYNRVFIQNLLREQMGFTGYVNSDTGIIQGMCWGVEVLDEPERIGFAINQSGVDVIGGCFANESAMKAYERATSDWYDTHPVPEGFRKEDLVLTDESVNRAVARTMTEMFRMGLFDDPYRDPAEAEKVVATPADWAEADLVHHQSVTLLKNDGLLPLTAEKLAGKKIYAEAFAQTKEGGEKATKALRDTLAAAFTLTDNVDEADLAVLTITPTSGAYFSATQGYLELDLCENKTVVTIDKPGRPTSATHTETTVYGIQRAMTMADAIRARGGKVITVLNISLAWLPGNAEAHSDALLASFNTNLSAVLDVITGKFAPVGKLPVTLPRNDAVLVVNSDGVCVSPNDVPGYDKDQYMPDSLKDKNGKAYAYCDAAGNYYELGFGLTY